MKQKRERFETIMYTMMLENVTSLTKSYKQYIECK